jgi:hypothetical protein
MAQNQGVFGASLDRGGIVEGERDLVRLIRYAGAGNRRLGQHLVRRDARVVHRGEANDKGILRFTVALDLELHAEQLAGLFRAERLRETYVSGSISNNIGALPRTGGVGAGDGPIPFVVLALFLAALPLALRFLLASL